MPVLCPRPSCGLPLARNTTRCFCGARPRRVLALNIRGASGSSSVTFADARLIHVGRGAAGGWCDVDLAPFVEKPRRISRELAIVEWNCDAEVRVIRLSESGTIAVGDKELAVCAGVRVELPATLSLGPEVTIELALEVR